jgi:hypothetical protein
MRPFKNILLLFALFLTLISCEKDGFITNPSAVIRFSVDTLYFDTVFTAMGTTTKSFTIHNPHKEFIRISNLSLAKGPGSVFRINVDGIPGFEFRDLEIPPGDSIYVFVEATPALNNSPEILLQQDSIVTITNGKTQDIDIVAWGQDVHILRREYLQTQHWSKDKPYLVIDYAVVDSGQVLTIDPGVKIYLHRDAVFGVLGSLVALGDTADPIIFAGDRLEKMYEDVPGLWGGIYLAAGSYDNRIDNAIIRNGTFGIIVDTVINSNPTLVLSNSLIAHVSSIGILGRGAKITGYNNVITNCGSSAVALTIGGDYSFYHCTFANRWIYAPFRKNPVVYLNNYYFYKETLPGGAVVDKAEIRDIENAFFGNCIIYGNLDNELIVDKYPGAGLLEYRFENCLGRFSPDKNELSNSLRFENLINNQDPRFIDWDGYIFQLDTLSPARDKGNPLTAMNYPFDKIGLSRVADGNPDIGAFEWTGD